MTLAALTPPQIAALRQVAATGDAGLPVVEVAPSVLARLRLHPHGPLVEVDGTRLVVTEDGLLLLPSSQSVPVVGS